MARHASTYRQARRHIWRNAYYDHAPGELLTWDQFNQANKIKIKGKPDILIGNVRSEYTPYAPQPNKYVPHIGAKQRAKAVKA
jgi:hypothetical protein